MDKFYDEIDNQLIKKEIKRLKKTYKQLNTITKPIINKDLPKKYNDYLLRAFKKKLSFLLSVEEFMFIINKPCIYCGSNINIGIDRESAKEGYTVDNSVPCCTMCNMMKYTYHKNDFLEHIKKIYLFNIKQNI